MRRIPKHVAAEFAGFLAALVVVWYAFSGIGPWAGLNEYFREDPCTRVDEAPNGIEHWSCEDGHNPHMVRYDRATDSYYIRACTLVQSQDGANMYRCREEVG